MKKLCLSVSVACAVAMISSVRADGNWTGAVDGYWTNANNWAEGRVPGLYHALDAEGHLVTNGAPCDTVYFGDALTGNAVTTINFDGVHSVSNLLTVGKTARYTYGTKSDQYVPIAALGTFSAGETPDTLVATVAGRLQTGVDCFEVTYDAKNDTYSAKYGGDMVTIRNNSSEEFVLGAWGWRTTKWASGKDPEHLDSKGNPVSLGQETGICWDGTGDIRYTKTRGGNQPSPQTTFQMTGKWTLEAEYYCRAFNVKTGTLGSGLRQIEIRANGSLKHGAGYYNFINTGAPTRIFGEGALIYAAGYNSGQTVKWKCSQNTISSPLTIACPVSMVWGANAPTDANGGTSFMPYFWHNGAGIVTFEGPDASNTATGLVWLASVANSTVECRTLGLRGTYGSQGDCDFRLANNATLRYTGAGEKTDRTIIIQNGLPDNATKAIPQTATLEQAGTGSLVVESVLDASDGATLTLKNDTEVDATFAKAIEGNVNIEKSGSGTWKLSGMNTSTGTIKVKEGTLYVCRGASLASSS